MNVLVTGGAGYIGSTLCEYLLNAGHKVTVLDSFLYSQDSLNLYYHNKNFEVVSLDVRDPEIKKYVKKNDIIIPLAGLVGASLCDYKKDETIQVNFESIKTIVDNLSKDQIILYPTTNSGYGIGQGDKHCTEDTPLNPISLYGKTKVRAEEYVEKHQNSARFRLATVFGCSPRMRLDLLVNDFVFKSVKDKYIVLFESNFKRNYIHVRDVCRVFMMAMDSFDKFKGETFNVGLSTANLSKLELCQKIKQHNNNFEISLNEFGKDLDKRDYIVSNQKIENRGFKAEFSLDHGIIELIKLFKFLIPNNSMRNF
jgi:nucleoside-diphosphate-sugar epimerase